MDNNSAAQSLHDWFNCQPVEQQAEILAALLQQAPPNNSQVRAPLQEPQLPPQGPNNIVASASVSPAADGVVALVNALAGAATMAPPTPPPPPPPTRQPIATHAMQTNETFALPSTSLNNGLATPTITTAATPAPPQTTQTNELEQLLEPLDRVCLQVDEAIKSIPEADKEAYLEAKEKAPDLVQTESDVMEFVRYCKYDAWSAATRLCLYWKERKKLFENRAFLPLVLTGCGALTKEDLLTLKAGFPAILPDSSKGHKVVLVDRRKWIPSATAENKLRCLWFLFNVLSKYDRAQTEKKFVEVLVLHIAPRVCDADDSYLDRASYIVGKVFPIYFSFNIGIIPSPRQPYAVQSVLAKSCDYVLERFPSMPNVMIQREPGQLLQDLQEDLNLTPEGIPMDIGGEWQVDTWFQWCQNRQEREQREFDWLTQEAPNHLEDSNVQHGSPKLTEEEKMERRRLADLLHSRRKRERRKIRFSSIQSESSRLTELNLQLKAEQSRLEHLLEEAEGVIKRLKRGDDD